MPRGELSEAQRIYCLAQVEAGVRTSKVADALKCNNYDRKRSELDTVLRGSPYIALVPVLLLLLFTLLLNPRHRS
jgi:hypothetical protein